MRAKTAINDGALLLRLAVILAWYLVSGTYFSHGKLEAERRAGKFGYKRGATTYRGAIPEFRYYLKDLSPSVSRKKPLLL